MTDHPENPPAFPRPGFEQCAGMQDGMTLRDYFAAAALPSVVAATSAGQHMLKSVGHDMIAQDAYRLADAMLRERGK